MASCADERAAKDEEILENEEGNNGGKARRRMEGVRGQMERAVGDGWMDGRR